MKVCTVTTQREFPNPERILSFVIGNVSGPDAYHNEPNIGVVPAMQILYERNQEEDVLCFIHDDVTCYDPQWAPRVLAEFEDPKTAIVGFGGATGIGVDEIYKRPYHITQLQRINYASNARDAETHGTRETGSKNVAVLDGYFLAIRTSFLKEIGGWSGFKFNFHMYDAYVCLCAIERGYKVRLVGCDVMHHGGGTSTTPQYIAWCKEQGTTVEREHQEPHKFIYERFRSILPVRITP